jgi:hypothetical protein
MPKTKENFTPHHKRITKEGKRYDAPKAGYTRKTFHVEKITLQNFQARCDIEGITYSEGVSEALQNWLASW